jgi:apolipoprotein N-acyltransferase
MFQNTNKRSKKNKTDVYPPAVAAISTAVLLFLAMPGHFGWWPLLFVSLIPLLRAALYLPPRKSWVMGLLAGLIYHVLTLYWLVVVLGKYGGMPLWIGVAAMVLLSAYMALYWGVFCFLLSLLAGRHWQKERSIIALVMVAPLLWVGLETLRGILFTGFPWLDIGYGLYSQPTLIQAADIGGHHLVSFTVVLVCAFITAIIDRQNPQVNGDTTMEKRLLFVACSFIIFVFGYSILKHQTMTPIMNRAITAEITVVQGNILQDEKWQTDRKEDTIDIYKKLSRQGLRNTTELLVWPETALPFYPQRNPLGEKVAEFTREKNIYLLTGAPTFTTTTSDNEPLIRHYNSGLLFSPSGEIIESHAKQHLVPFGEYVPLREFLFFLSPLVKSSGDFSAGESSRPLMLGESIRIGLLICYESIFPEIARDKVALGANLLVNITNDAWYGKTSAPYQSMAMAVFRAVETKRSLARAANTGISGFVDPVGNVTLETDIFTPAAITARIPILDGETIFVRYGYKFGIVCLAMIPVLLIFPRRFV